LIFIALFAFDFYYIYKQSFKEYQNSPNLKEMPKASLDRVLVYRLSQESCDTKVDAKSIKVFNDKTLLSDVEIRSIYNKKEEFLKSKRLIYKDSSIFLKEDSFYLNSDDIRLTSDDMEYALDKKMLISNSAFLLTQNKNEVTGNSFIYDINNSTIKAKKIVAKFDIKE
jgi:hypothetical protein